MWFEPTCGHTCFILKDPINLVILNSFHSLVSVHFKTIIIIIIVIVIITVIVAIYVDSVIIFSGYK
jgi:hypothetical protein